MIQLTDRIKKIRKLTNLSQLLFAERIGVSRSHISKIETGSVVPSNQLIKSICREFGVREKWLREGKGRIEEKPLTYEEIERLESELIGNAYNSAAQRFRVCTISINSTIDIIKPCSGFMVESNRPEVIEFLKAKKLFQKSLNKLQKMLLEKEKKQFTK